MPKPSPTGYPIFISYRRSDLSLEAEWLHSLIRTFFGEQTAFFDRDGIEGGTRWDDTLRTCVRSSRMVLIMIGPGWLKAQAPSGQRRLDHEEDWVRQEVLAAIAAYEDDPAGVRIFPVLLNGVELPRRDWLPGPLAPLASFQLEAALQFDIRNYLDSAAAIHAFLWDHLGRLEPDGVPGGWRPMAFSRDRVPNPYDIPGYQLPEELRLMRPRHPYKSLQYFTRADAGIFFGRGREVGELIDVFKKGHVLCRLFGQSGVGKSSLLFAGLLPRLEAKGWKVHYRRHDPALPLPRLFESILEELAAFPDQDGLIILDQLEDLVIDPDAGKADDLNALATAAARLGALNASRRKPIRVIWSYRKEYDVNFKTALRDRGVATAEYWLRNMDRNGLCEAILGVTRDRDLQAEYRLEIEDGLADLILSDLLAHGEVDGVTPLLQVLLRKMWDRVCGSSGSRELTRDAYAACKSADLLQLLQDQLGAVGAQEDLRSAVASGLALDVLRRFVSAQDTRLRLSEGDLAAAYADSATVKRLVQALVDHYLLVREDGPAYTLAHDTLARTVRQQYAGSESPGPRAARLFESKARDIEADPESVDFSKADLVTIDEGLPGMRRLLDREGRAVAASRARRQQEQQNLEEKNRQLELALARERRQTLLARSNWLSMKASQEPDATEAIRYGLAAYKAAATPAALRTLYGRFDHAFMIEKAPIYHTLVPGIGHSVAALAGGKGLLLSGIPDNRGLSYYDLATRTSREVHRGEKAIAKIFGSQFGFQALVRRADESAELVDAQSGQVLGSNGPFEFEHAVFAADGRLYIHLKSRIFSVDPAEGLKREEVLALHQDELIFTFAVSPDAGRFLIATREKRIFEYQAAAAQLNLLAEMGEIVNHLHFVSSRQVLVCDLWRDVSLLDLDNGTFDTAQSADRNVKFLQGTTLACGKSGLLAYTQVDDARTIRVWANGRDFKLIGAPDAYFDTLDLAPESGLAITAGSRGVQLWELARTILPCFTGGKEVLWIKGSRNAPEFAAVYPGEIHWFDLRSRDERAIKLPASGSDFVPSEYCTDIRDRIIAYGGKRGPLFLFDLNTNLATTVQLDFEGEVSSLHLSGGIAWLTDQDGSLHAYDVKQGSWRHFRLDQPIRALAAAPDGRIAMGMEDGSVRIAHIEDPTAAVESFHKLTKPPRYMVWTPDAQCLFVGGWNRFGVLARPASSAFLRLELEHWATGAAFSKDGKLLATTSQDGMLRIFDAVSGELVRNVQLESDIGDCHFADDGKRLYVVLSQTKAVASWLLDEPAEIEARLTKWTPILPSQQDGLESPLDRVTSVLSSDDPATPFSENLPPLTNFSSKYRDPW